MFFVMRMVRNNFINRYYKEIYQLMKENISVKGYGAGMAWRARIIMKMGEITKRLINMMTQI